MRSLLAQKFRASTASAVFIAILIAISLLGETLSGDAGAFSNDVMERPSATHWLGTDDLGRDVLRGILQGTRISIAVGVSAAFASVIIGIAIGAAAGYFGGILDLIVMRIAEFFQVMPTFIMAAVIVAFLGPGLTRIVAVIALLAWPQVARIMRGEVMRLKNLEFVDAVRCLGFSNLRILAFEIIPNALPPVLAVSTLIVGQAILLEASLSFLGLGSPDAISWGRMLSNGQRFLFNAPWLSIFPGLAIFLTVLAFNLAGDAVSSLFDPRRSR
jgi:peptide/nickel transport system permease protein